MGDTLTQEEINALLAGGDDMPDEPEQSAPEPSAPEPVEAAAASGPTAPAPSAPASAAAPVAPTAPPAGGNVSYAGPPQFNVPPPKGDISMVSDISMDLTVILAKTRLPLKDALALKPGEVVDLDKIAGEPVEIFVNKRLFARGTIVVIDENFGVRVSEILNPESADALIG